MPKPLPGNNKTLTKESLHGCAAATGTLTPKASVAVIHNHPIHYKHLLFAAMKDEGLDFEVLFVSQGSSDRIEPIQLCQQTYRFRIGQLGPYERHSRLGAALYIWRSLSELDAQLVIISGCYDIAGWTAWAWANLKFRKRVLWNEVNVFDRPRRWYKEFLKKLFVRRCHCAHVYGQSHKQYLLELGMSSDRIKIKQAVTNTRLFRIMPEVIRDDTRPLELLYVGRFSPEKNLQNLITSISMLKQDVNRPKVKLSLVGYGPLDAELKHQVTYLSLQSVIRFEGPLLQLDLATRYNKADVFILPSTREPWGLVALEAMLCGLPVIASSQCGCAIDLITDETGWTFSPSSEDSLTRMIETVASTPRGTLREMGRAAAELGQKYSPEACAAVVTRSVDETLRKSQTI